MSVIKKRVCLIKYNILLEKKRKDFVCSVF